MYLKSLVLKGFKSFADRSALTLEPGITAVVGPNGSGKSNISDALLWVLGERSARNLRGQAMEDVIFAGSSARKSVNVAEVELVLDNSDGSLPLDYSEISIARRIYRNGDNEYLLNGSIVRRMDVVDVLHDAGLGAGSQSIISQGSLDSVLRSHPEDRRALIEEAAGILKHKQRKLKSQRKLEQMDQHLARISDVSAEVARQLGPLERKAKRAQTHERLTAELSDLKLVLAVDDLRVLQRSWDEAVATEEGLAAKLKTQQEELDAAESHAEVIQRTIQKESADVGELARQHRRATSAAERLDGAALLLREKRRAARDFKVDALLQITDAQAKRERTEADLAASRADLEGILASKSTADALVERLTAQQADNAKARRELERTADDLMRESRRSAADRDRLQRELAQTTEALNSGMAHVRVVESRSKELEVQVDRAVEEAKKFARAARDMAAELQEKAEAEAEARKQVALAVAARDEARKASNQARENASALTGEIRALEEIDRASISAAPVRKWLIDRAEGIQGGVSPLFSAIRAKKGAEELVEHVLASDLSSLLVTDADAAAAAANLLEGCPDAGQVSLLPKTDAATAAPCALELERKGVGRALISEMTYPDSLARVVEALLGDVVVCENRAAAFAAHAAYPGGARFMSEDGCIICPDGKVLLGRQSQEGNEGALARGRRLDELHAQEKDAREQVEQAVAAEQRAEEELRQTQAASLVLTQDLAELKGRADAAEADSRRAEEKLAALNREAADVQRQREEAELTVSKARPTVDQLTERLRELDEKREADAQKLQEAQDGVVPLRQEAAKLRDALAEAKLDAAKLSERAAYTKRLVEARVNDLATIDSRIADSRQAALAKMVALSRVEPLLATVDEILEGIRRKTAQLEEASVAAQDSSSALHQRATEARGQVREVRERFDLTNERISQLRVDKGRLEIQVKSAIDVIVKDCQTPLDRALDIPEPEDRPQMEEDAERLTRRIANLGAVNPEAAQEYEQLKERYDYLAAQVDDLKGARRSLERIVKAIDARMQDDFAQTFEQVDQNFQRIFQTLFPGGSGKLTLVDPDNMDTTGIEVTAQPRGKRITKMSLMSGGEKSLTALALLFALYQFRKAPFFVLDEVEAALDDSNLRRLISYLEGLRQDTQLVMITHQRRTMEMADVLFGVSMQTDGVTKVISQKLDHALRYAE